MRNLLTLAPGVPATDSGRSMDFDRIQYTGPLGSGFVSVEVSYRELVATKFELVKPGNHRARIEETIARFGGQYDDAIRAVAPDAPAYEAAAKTVLGRLASLLP